MCPGPLVFFNRLLAVSACLVAASCTITIDRLTVPMALRTEIPGPSFAGYYRLGGEGDGPLFVRITTLPEKRYRLTFIDEDKDRKPLDVPVSFVEQSNVTRDGRFLAHYLGFGDYEVESRRYTLLLSVCYDPRAEHYFIQPYRADGGAGAPPELSAVVRKHGLKYRTGKADHLTSMAGTPATLAQVRAVAADAEFIRLVAGPLIPLTRREDPFTAAPAAAPGQESAADSNARLNAAFDAGMKALQAKEYDSALKSFSTAADIDPKQHVVWAHVAEACSGLAGAKPDEERRRLLARAVDAYRRAVELKPDEAAYWNNYARFLATDGQIADARAAVLKAIALDPPNAGRYRFNLGAILTNAGEDAGAIEAFKSVDSGSPHYTEARFQMHRLERQSAAFASTLRAYIEAARNGFQSLRGKEHASAAGVRVFDSLVMLPGATDCGIMISPGSNQLSCGLAKSASKEQLTAEYQRLIPVLRAVVPTDWKAMDLGSFDAGSRGYQFQGPLTSLHLTMGPGSEGYDLSVSVAAN